jgi:hemin uptake protein HemP
MTAPPPQPSVPPTRALPTPAPRCIPSGQLFGSATEVQIEHRGTLYRLKQTALGKLILTK